MKNTAEAPAVLVHDCHVWITEISSRFLPKLTLHFLFYSEVAGTKLFKIMNSWC